MKHRFITYNFTGTLNLVINNELSLVSQEDISSPKLERDLSYRKITKNIYELEIPDKEEKLTDFIASQVLLKAVEKVITLIMHCYNEDHLQEDLPALREELRFLVSQMLPLTNDRHEDLEGILEKAWIFTREVLILKYVDSSTEEELKNEGPIIYPELTREFEDKYLKP